MSSVLNIPQSNPIDPRTGRWAPEWLQWIVNPKFLSIDTGTALGVASGGTGLASTPPANSFLLGDGTGYTLTTTLPAALFPAFSGDLTSSAGSTSLTLKTVNTNTGAWGNGTQVASFTVNAKGLITAAANTDITGAPGDFTAVGKFGCNGKTAQSSSTVNTPITSTAGAAYTATEQTMLNDLKALVNQLRTALVNNGIAV